MGAAGAEAAKPLTEARVFFEEHFAEYNEKHPGRHLMLVQESRTRRPVMFLPTVFSG